MADITNRPGERKLPRGLELALFGTAMLWAATAFAIAGRAASGIANRFRFAYGQPLLESLFLLFLVIIGFQTLDLIAIQGSKRTEVVPLPNRATAGREWGTGVAIGWGLCLAAVIPVLLAGRLRASFNHGAGVAPGVAASLGTLLVLSLAEEVIFRGYPFHRIARALSPAWAAVIMSLLFAAVLVGLNRPVNFATAILDGTLFGLVLTIAYLRTYALWLGWGLHFGYRAVMAVLFGLPLSGRSDFGSLVDATTGGPRWLTGGMYGLDGAVLTALVMMGGIAVIYRVTRDWAWAYTTPEIVSAGYEVVIAPPAAHVAMEKTAAPPPLVQILPTTPQSFSAQGDSSIPKG